MQNPKRYINCFQLLWPSPSASDLKYTYMYLTNLFTSVFVYCCNRAMVTMHFCEQLHFPESLTTPICNRTYFWTNWGFTHSFTFYPITLGKTVQRYYPPTLMKVCLRCLVSDSTSLPNEMCI